MTSSWTDEYDAVHLTTLDITRNNITFIGSGKDETTILGGFAIVNLENISFKNMTVTNTSGGGMSNTNTSGMSITMSNAKVELIDVVLKGCANSGLYIPESTSETTVVATRCKFANNGSHGVVVEGSLTSATFNNCVFHDNSGN
jgi:pectate lyase